MFSPQTSSVACFAVIMTLSSSFSWAQRAYNASRAAISPMDAGGGGSGETAIVIKKPSGTRTLDLDDVLPTLSPAEINSIKGTQAIPPLQYSREQYYRPKFLDGDISLYLIFIDDNDGFGENVRDGTTKILPGKVQDFARNFNLLTQWKIVQKHYFSNKIDFGTTKFFPGRVNYKGSKTINMRSGSNLCGRSDFETKIKEAFDGTNVKYPASDSENAVYIVLIDDHNGFSYKTSSSCDDNLWLGQAGPGGSHCSLHDYFTVNNKQLFFGIVKVPSSGSNCLQRMFNLNGKKPNGNEDDIAGSKTQAVLNGVFHEIVESVLSPYPAQGWSVKSPKTGNYFEVADICETVFLDYSRYHLSRSIQSIYNPVTKKCSIDPNDD